MRKSRQIKTEPARTYCRKHLSRKCETGPNTSCFDIKAAKREVEVPTRVATTRADETRTKGVEVKDRTEAVRRQQHTGGKGARGESKGEDKGEI